MHGLSAVRYTTASFPPYSFLPGRTPHPHFHPEGHRFRLPRPAGGTVAPERWRESAEYLLGCDLYNHGYWWEAHEAWERIWLPTERTSVQGRFAKALIQTSACHLILCLGRTAAVAPLWRRAEAGLERATEAVGAPAYMGLDVRAWRRSVDAYFQTVLANGVTRPAPADYPYIRLDGMVRPFRIQGQGIDSD